MKKNTKIIISIAAVLIIACGVGFAATRSAQISDYESAGSLYRAVDGTQETSLAAEYRGEKRTMETLEYQRRVARDTTSSDYELAYKLMGSAILYQYAVENGYDYDKSSLPSGAQEYIDERMNDIIADAQSEVIYYVPVTG